MAKNDHFKFQNLNIKNTQQLLTLYYNGSEFFTPIKLFKLSKPGEKYLQFVGTKPISMAPSPVDPFITSIGTQVSTNPVKTRSNLFQLINASNPVKSTI